MSTQAQEFKFGSIILPAILPTLLFSTGQGAIIPIIPIAAGNLGASLAIAGLIAAMMTLGQLCGDIPSGWIVSRIGERNAMVGAAGLAVIGVTLALIAPNPFVLGVGVLFVGLAAAAFQLARHAFMTSFVPKYFRARALSTLGGAARLGLFIGPFISVAVIHITGNTQSVFWVQVVFALATAILLFVLRDPSEVLAANRAESGQREGEALVAAEQHGLFKTVWKSRGMLLKLGAGAALFSALRQSRTVILPLWALSIGVPDAQIALIIGIAGAIDFALFYAGGQIMDRFGRLWGAVPAMLGLTAGHLMLAFTHSLSNAFGWFLAAAVLMAITNGVGSGVIMTLGADLADPRNPAQFLGAWRFTTDAGGASAPLLISAITAALSIAFAAGFIGILGLVGTGLMIRYVPRYVPHRPAQKTPSPKNA